MKRFWIYLRLQFKRMAMAFPAVFCMTVILAGGIGLLVWMQVRLSRDADGQQKVNLGIVGDAEESYLGMGIYVLENLDASRYTINFSHLEEEEAKTQLEMGKINGYIRIPEGFVESVVSGENLPVTFVAGGSQAGIGSALVLELADTISEIITQSQAGLYCQQEFYLRQGELETIYQDMDELNLRYFDMILNRNQMYDIQLVGGRMELSAAGYYFCAMLLAFFLLWGMNCGTLLVKKDMAMPKVLSASGLGAWAQIAGEFAAYLGFMLMNYAGITGILMIGMKIAGMPLPEVGSTGELLGFCFRIWPVLLCVAALQFLLYSVVSGLISGLLLNFISAAALGYLSGCFYPVSYFPRMLRNLAGVLPTGTGLAYMTARIKGNSDVGAVCRLLLFAAGALAVSAVLRKKKLEQ